jgi:ferrochelatase
MKEDGITRAIAFSQFPQWSCTTSGSSMNELWRKLRELDMVDQFKWSAIDRWHLHPGFIDSVTDRIEEKMLEFDEKDRENVVLLFSAHSVPMKVVEKGDHYVPEVAATVHAVMERWAEKAKATDGLVHNKHILAWQSKVGYLPWMSPSTSTAIEACGKRGEKNVLVVPIAFTSDHIETLFEIGIEYAEVQISA